jgi:hypothetical protein
MRKILTWSAALTLAALAQYAVAQGEDRPAMVSYVTYYVCDVATQGNMDNLVAANEKPVFDQWVEDGKLVAWGYLSHFTGGRWRRAQYHVSPTIDDAFRVQDEIFRSMYEDNRAGGQARAEACEGHEDYVWSVDAGSAPGVERGDVSLSVYFVCDVADQRRADAIFAEIYAPYLDGLQADREIASWSWQSHLLGGRYRRLQTVTGEDYGAVNRARFGAIQHVNQNHPQLAREFAQICDEHEDYLWDIVHESP